MATKLNTLPTLRGMAAAILIGLTCSLTGCAAMQPNAEESELFEPDWSESLRAPGENQASGLSGTSRQIERNLGFE